MKENTVSSSFTTIPHDKRPSHVAIIMDGNGRWAKKRNLPRLFGHRAGAKAVRSAIKAAEKIGIKVLTLYAFSTENWMRPKKEIDGLMRLLKQTLQKEKSHLMKRNIRLTTIGDLSPFPSDIREELKRLETFLSQNSGLQVVLALNYGGRQDIVRAVNRLIQKGVKTVTEEMITGALSTASLPPLDLVIRTSGEMRISNFLLWEFAYSEFYVTKTLWPDFDEKEFFRAIRDYALRERRFGGL